MRILLGLFIQHSRELADDDNGFYRHLVDCAKSHGAILDGVAVAPAADKLLEQLRNTCICDRNTYGFDYGETHPKLGKPGPGKRWLTPTDIIDETRKVARPAASGESLIKQMWEADQKVYREQEQQLKHVRSVLKELCELKIIKDVQGETGEYCRRKPKAWEAAFACFREYVASDERKKDG